MKWIGQHIWDFISRFRSDVYLEGTETGTIAAGGNLGLDSNNKIVKAVNGSGDLTITNAADNRIVTSTGGTGLNAESTLTYQVTAPFAEQLIVGDDDNGSAAFGRRAHSDGTGGALSIFAGSATNGQTNQNGGDLRLYGGQPTGSGTFGNIEFHGGRTWVSGTGLRGTDRIGLIANNAATSTDFYLYERAGITNDDYLKISVAEHGATTISTTDDNAHAADLTITADGDAEIAADVITLDSAGDIDLEVGAATNYVDTNGLYRGGNIGPISDGFIPLTPQDFVAADSYRFYPNMATDGRSMAPSSAGSFYIAQKIIPKGYTASTFRVNGVDGGSNAASFTVYQNDITGTAALAATLMFAFNTDQAVISGKDIVGDGEKFCTIKFDPGDLSDIIYGGKIYITKTT